jgi:hypothetical protein
MTEKYTVYIRDVPMNINGKQETCSFWITDSSNGAPRVFDDRNLAEEVGKVFNDIGNVEVVTLEPVQEKIENVGC